MRQKEIARDLFILPFVVAELLVLSFITFIFIKLAAPDGIVYMQILGF